MLQAFLNIFRIADLRSKVLFTLGMLIIYRIGFWIPLVGGRWRCWVRAG